MQFSIYLCFQNLKQIANYEKCINYRLHRSDRFGTNHEIESIYNGNIVAGYIPVPSLKGN